MTNSAVTPLYEHVACDVCRAAGRQALTWTPVLLAPVMRAGQIVSTGLALVCHGCAQAGIKTQYPVVFHALPGLIGVDGVDKGRAR